MRFLSCIVMVFTTLAVVFVNHSQDSAELIRMLVVGDPFARALQAASPIFEAQYGLRLDIEVVGYNETRQITLMNALDSVSSYDLVSFDVLWMGEYATQGILAPLDAWIAQAPELDVEDFVRVAYGGSGWEGVQYGLPIQPHPELLWVRKDLLAQAGLEPPQTTDELLAVAEALHQEEGRAALCWNAQRRQPLGQTMAHLYAAFGQPLLGDDGLPALNTPRGLRAAEYALALSAYDPPDALTMAWDQLMLAFARDRCAMTTGWGARSYMVEDDPSSLMAGQVSYLAAPHAPDAPPVTPFGTWSLGIPANIGPRAEVAWRALRTLASKDGQRLLAENGNGGMPRISLLRDPDLQERYPAFATVLQLAESSQLSDAMRPAVPQWPALELILGTVFHDMLRGKYTPQQAVDEAQRQALAVFEAR